MKYLRRFESLESKEYKIDFIKKMVDGLKPDYYNGDGDPFYHILKTNPASNEDYRVFNHNDKYYKILYIKTDWSGYIIEYKTNSNDLLDIIWKYTNLDEAEDFMIDEIYNFYLEKLNGLDMDTYFGATNMGLL